MALYVNKTNDKLIYHTWILNTYLSDWLGVYPKEIVGLCIMSDYHFPKISSGMIHSVIFTDRIYFSDKANEWSEMVFADKIKSVECGGAHTIAITYVPNKIYVWGSN